VPNPPELIRRPSFWLIVVLVIVIPTVAFFSTQWLLRVLDTSRHPPGSTFAPAAAVARGRG